MLSGHSVGIHQANRPHSPRQETLSNSHLSSLSHCGLILGLKQWSWCARADLHFKKKKVLAGK